MTRPAPARQLELPGCAEPEPAPAPLPEARATACARCGWYRREDERTCPLCHAPEDT